MKTRPGSSENLLHLLRDVTGHSQDAVGRGKTWDPCCEHVSALPQFFVLLLIILLAEVTLAILLFVYEQKVSYTGHNSLYCGEQGAGRGEVGIT